MSGADQVDGVDLNALDYTVHVPYNGTEAQGANPLDFDVNVWYNVRHDSLYLHCVPSSGR